MIKITYFEGSNNVAIAIHYDFDGNTLAYEPQGNLMNDWVWNRLIDCIANNVPFHINEGGNSSTGITYNNQLVTFKLAALGDNAGGTLNVSTPLTVHLLNIFKIVREILRLHQTNERYPFNEQMGIKVHITIY